MDMHDKIGSGDGASRVHLSEAAQAVEDVLTSCRAELQFLRRRLQGREGGPEENRQMDFTNDKSPSKPPNQEPSGEEPPPSPRDQALHIASRLEACASALRNASSPEGPTSS